VRPRLVLPNPTSEIVFGFFIEEVDITPLVTAGQENAVGVLHEVQELVFAVFYGRVKGVFWETVPFIRFKIIPQVLPENDADIVELKSLGCINTPDLRDAVRVIGPERGLGYSSLEPGDPVRRVPGSSELANDYILHQGTVWVRLLGPVPAIPCRQPPGKSLRYPFLYRFLQRLR